MEIRDYVRMLRRGWLVVLFITLLSVGLAAAYAALAPKQYEATAVIFVSTSNPKSITDLQQGSQFATNTAATYADIVGSAAVLGPVSERLRPSRSEQDLEGMVQAKARDYTSLIDVTATAGQADQAAEIANAAARTASTLIPSLTADGGSRRSPVTLQVVRTAPEPKAPLSPDAKRVLALGLILGLGLGLAVTITNQALDTRLRRLEDVRQLTTLPLLAVLPRPKRSQRAAVVVRDDPASAAVESYRSLRTNLSYLEDGARRSLLFTGVAEDRVGVQVPVNLAWSIAQAGRRVLLMDLDLRQSLVGNMLHLRGDTGVADVLAEKVDLRSVVHKTTQPGLHVVLSGTVQPSPSDLLSNPVMESLIRKVEQDYDYVVLHAPPLLTYTDSAVISRVAGQTLVTVSAGHTKAFELSTALAALNNVRVQPLGIVLAGSRTSLGDMGKVRGLRARTRPTSTQPSYAGVDWVLPDEVDGKPARRRAL